MNKHSSIESQLLALKMIKRLGCLKRDIESKQVQHLNKQDIKTYNRIRDLEKLFKIN